jgi:hypothetical protein
MTTVIYYTDGRLPADFAALVRRWLVWAAGNCPIVVVSQTPVPGWPDAIVTGEITSSYRSLLAQVTRGIEAARTDTIACAEHDCLYTPEQFTWQPPRPDVLYYNLHHWFLQWTGPSRGVFTNRRRLVLSQLVASRDVALEAFRQRLWMVEHEALLETAVSDAMTIDDLREVLFVEPGTKDHKPAYGALQTLFAAQGVTIQRWPKHRFRTVDPNVDLRHDLNWTGARVGQHPRLTLPPWGTLADIERGPA